MSAQAGVFYFDLRPVDPAVIVSLGRSIDAYGPDRSGQYIAPGVAMVHRALDITPEDCCEHQPFISPRGNVMTWDGRLDNREDLLFQLWHDLDHSRSDVALAMAAYERWGTEGFAKLIGDWSLVLFQPHTNSVVMASDYMGVRPLHYCVRPDSVTWSTALRSLVDLHSLHDDLEERFVVGFLSLTTPPCVTPYKGVHAVRTAHSLTVDRSGSVTVAPFWRFTSNDIRYKDERDYEVALRRSFVDAVRDRLRSTHPVWAQLSGGLDSSSIVCAADALISERAAIAPELSTVSYITDGSPETDERRFIACVDQPRGRTSHYLQFDESIDVVDSDNWSITPTHPSGSALQTYDLIRRSGGRLLLTGSGGDSIMGNCLDYHYDVARLIQCARPGAAVRQARRRALAAQRTIIDVMYEAVLELRPSYMLTRRVLSKLMVYAGGAPPASDAHVADLFLLKPRFASWWRDEWIRRIASSLTFPNLAYRRPASELMRMSDGRNAQAPSELPMAVVSHPYLDRRLVEFMLSIPISVVVPPGQPRGLMRRAFAPFVPHRIISRISKGYASPFLVRNFRNTVSEWLGRGDTLRVANLECIDRDRLTRYLESLRDGTTQQVQLFSRLFALEQWLEFRQSHLLTSAQLSHTGKEVTQHGIPETVIGIARPGVRGHSG